MCVFIHWAHSISGVWLCVCIFFMFVLFFLFSTSIKQTLQQTIINMHMMSITNWKMTFLFVSSFLGLSVLHLNIEIYFNSLWKTNEHKIKCHSVLAIQISSKSILRYRKHQFNSFIFHGSVIVTTINYKKTTKFHQLDRHCSTRDACAVVQCA